MRFIYAFLLLLLLEGSLHAQIISVETISSNIQQSLQQRLKGQNKPIVQALYQQAGYKPLWIGPENRSKMNQLILALQDPMFNYKNKAFDQQNIAQYLYKLDNNQINEGNKAAVYARVDMMLTNSFVRLVRFIVQGDVNWNLVQQKLYALKASNDITAHWDMTFKALPDTYTLFSAIASGEIYPYLNSLIPMEKRYKALIKLLKRYQSMPTFPKVEYANETLKLGDKSGRVEQVKQRLQVEGDYPKNAPIDRTFTKTLQRAVASFQKRYNIAVDGKVDKVTNYYLNLPISDNIQSIITNLDKTKLYPKSFEDEYIESNIPDFRLTYYKNGVPSKKMALVVGRIDRPTPLFEDKVRFMVLNPTWTVPDNLIKRDLIHVLRENPSYLEENNIHAFAGNNEIRITQAQLDPYENSDRPVPYRFVQYPGDKNALGRVKFMFPNKYDVYLHDTDNKSLFDQRYRVYSSGCMRVQKPMALMSTLLEHAQGSYTKSKIDQIFATNQPVTISLSKPVPIHIIYFTAYEENGKAYFRNDIYLYDKIIEESVEGNSKRTFTVPSKRLIDIKKNAQTVKTVSN
ncbi:MAG: L,D-transpeptidase family protein [Campylobacterales bacterium]|nr:L,D-transpeptidase family protein [Campylobacterales bacterium]